jgi:hypothetical protein
MFSATGQIKRPDSPFKFQALVKKEQDEQFYVILQYRSYSKMHHGPSTT